MLNDTGALEAWRAIPGQERAYEVSDFGGARSLPRVITRSNDVTQTVPGRTLRPVTGKNGYQSIVLPGRDRRLLHRLVLLTFVGPCPEGMEGCHNDGDKLNNRLSNLRWDTRSSNAKDRTAHGANWLASREQCPWGHLLTAPNLVAYRVKVGRSRSCLACQRAHNAKLRAARRGHTFDFQAEADHRYAEIMRVVR